MKSRDRSLSIESQRLPDSKHSVVKKSQYFSLFLIVLVDHLLLSVVVVDIYLVEVFVSEKDR